MIYLASSWRNPWYDTVLADLRRDGHDVYDFKATNFRWSDVSDSEDVPVMSLPNVLGNVLAADHFQCDLDALRECSTLILLLPCGNSAHTEFGIAHALGKRTIILGFSDTRLDLMYSCANAFADNYPLLTDLL